MDPTPPVMPPTERARSEWTLDSLLVYVIALITEADRRYEQRFEAQEQATQAALTAAKEAVMKAEAASEKRFDSVNEFRASLSDQTANLMPRIEAEQRLTQVNEKADRLASRQDKDDGRTKGVNASWGYLVGVVGMITAMITVLIHIFS